MCSKNALGVKKIIKLSLISAVGILGLSTSLNAGTVDDFVEEQRLKNIENNNSKTMEEKCSESGRSIVLGTGGVIGIVGGPIGIGLGAVIADKLAEEECKPYYEEQKRLKLIKEFEEDRLDKIKEKNRLLSATFEKGKSKIINTTSSIDLLNNKKIESIAVIGHASAVGKEDLNYKLALKRANAVKKYLIDEIGIDRYKISVQSKSFNDIKFPNDNFNQRAEIKVTYFPTTNIIVFDQKESIDNSIDFIDNY